MIFALLQIREDVCCKYSSNCVFALWTWPMFWSCSSRTSLMSVDPPSCKLYLGWTMRIGGEGGGAEHAHRFQPRARCLQRRLHVGSPTLPFWLEIANSMHSCRFPCGLFRFKAKTACINDVKEATAPHASFLHAQVQIWRLPLVVVDPDVVLLGLCPQQAAMISCWLAMCANVEFLQVPQVLPRR